MANNKTRHDPKDRHAQNLRTYARVQKRRAVHAKNHGITVESLGATRWTSKPESKSNK